jgi:hypothetical protein
MALAGDLLETSTAPSKPSNADLPGASKPPCVTLGELSFSSVSSISAAHDS